MRKVYPICLASVALALAWLGLVAALAPARAAEAVLYVAPGGSGDVCSLLAPCGSVQHAVDLAPPGAEVRIAGGVYSENLTLTRSVTLRGGWDVSFTAQTLIPGATVVQDAGAAQHNVRVGAQDTPLNAAIVLEALAFRNGDDGIHIWSSDDSGQVFMAHVLIANLTGQGIEVDGGSVVISSMTVLTAQRGMEVDAGVVYATGLSVAHTTEESFLLEAGGVVTISRSTFTDAGQQGVQINSGSAWFQDNTVARALSECVRINGGTVLLSRNVISAGLTAGYPGIYVEPDEGVTASVRIEYNRVYSIPDHGIYVRGALGDIFQNQVHDVSGNGIYVREGAATVFFNIVKSVGGRGIYVRDEDTPALEEAFIVANIVSNTGDVGIEVRGADVGVSGNDVADTAGRGISVEAGLAGIDNNHVERAGDDGIRTTDDCTRTVFSYNTVLTAANDGIDAGGEEIDLIFNTVSGSGDNGLKVTQTGAQSLLIYANRVFSNATLGIALRQAAQFRLINNIVADNAGGGIEISGDGAGDLTHNTLVGSGTGQQGVGVALLGNPDLALVNTLVVSHAVGVTGALASRVALTRTLLWANAADPIATTPFITPSNAAFFVDPARQDYHLRLDAPVVDAGVSTDVEADVDTENRPLGAAPDLGADEVQPPSWLYLPLVARNAPPPPPPSPAPPAYYLYISQSDLDYLAANPYLNTTVSGRFVADGRGWDVQVRYRGDTARTMPKRSWKVFFPNTDPFGDVWELNLNADYVDQTLLRSAVGYDLLARAGVPTPQAGYARLYLNDAYYGLFSQVEPLDEYFLARQGFDVHGNLYKPFYGNLNLLTADPYANANWWTYHYPKKTNERSNHADLWALMELIAYTPDADFAAAIAPVLDVNGWLDWYAANILLGNFEMLDKNYYLYHDFAAGKWRILPWDVDLALGHNASFGTYDPLLDYDVTWDNPIDSGSQAGKKVDGKWNALIDRMMAAPEFRYYHGRRLIELIHTEFSEETMAARIAYFYGSAAAYGAADANRWRAGDFPFSGGPDELMGYVAQRRAWLLEHLPAFMPAMQPPLSLNEWMITNTVTISDAAGDFDPWFELYNASPALTWNLGGMYLSDDPAQPRKWRIPDGTRLAPQSALLFWADGEPGEGALHTNFTLTSTGALWLSDGDLFANALIAHVTATQALPDVAYGAYPDGGATYVALATATPGGRNVGSPPAIRDVARTPVYPAAGAAITVSAQITAGGAFTATLWYRSTPPLALPDDYAPAPMACAVASATARCEAIIPMQPANSHVEYYVAATGANGLSSAARPAWPESDLDGEGSFHYVAGWQPPTVVINEVMPRNLTTVADEGGATPDWIELYNPGPQPVDLSGMYLTDDPAFPTQSGLPAGAVIPAGGYLLFWADETATGSHLTFSLSAAGESVALFDRLDRGLGRIDAAFFPPLGFDESWGRFPDGDGAWTATDSPTPGAPNRRLPPRFTSVTRSAQWPAAGAAVTVTAVITSGAPIVSATLWLDVGGGFAPLPLTGAPWQAVIPGQPQGAAVRYYLDAVDALGQRTAYPAGAPGVVEQYEAGYTPPPLLINEFLAANSAVNHDEYGEYDDWVELVNPGDAAVSLAGLSLSDDLAEPRKWAFPAGTVIPAGGYLLIWCDDQPEQGALHAPFKLAREGEALGLFDGDAHGNVALDSLSYGLQSEDISYGRAPSGGDGWKFFTTPTPGGRNE